MTRSRGSTGPRTRSAQHYRKSPIKPSRFPSSGRSNTQPAPWYSQSRPANQGEKKEESSHREKEKAEKAEEARKRLEEKIILKYPGTYISDRIVEMKSERFTDKVRSLRFFEGGALSLDKGDYRFGRLALPVRVDPAFTNSGYPGVPAAVLLQI